MKCKVLFLVACFLFFFAVGCSNNPTDSGKGPASEADKQQAQKLSASADSVISEMIKASSGEPSLTLQGSYLKTAKNLYSDAVSLDPDNIHANFGASISGFQSLIEDPDFQAIKTTLVSWNTTIIDHQDPRYILAQFFLFGKTTFQVGQGESATDYDLDPLSSFTALMSLAYGSLSDPNIVSLLQNKIDTLIIPQINSSIGYMDKVLANKNFEFILTPEMTGQDLGIEMDLGDAYLFSAVMSAMKGVLEIMNAYQLSVPGITNPFDYANQLVILPLIKSQDLNHGPFLKLRNTSMLPQAKSDLLASVQKVKSGVQFIKAETDDQATDLISQQVLADAEQQIPENLADYVSIFPGLSEVTDFVGLANKLNSYLSGPYSVEMGEGMEPITMNLSAFLNNGIPDFKNIIPYHTWANLNDFPLEFTSSGINTQIFYINNTNIECFAFNIMDYYNEATNSYNPYYYFTGSFSSEGIFTVQGRVGYSGYDTILEPMKAGDKLIDDGSFYLDTQNRFCMTEAAYSKFSMYVLTHPNLFFDSVGNMENVNYSATHPLGYRNGNGVFLFSGAVNYLLTSEQSVVYMSTAANSGSQVAAPVFPDPTFGGLFPNMTQQKLLELWGSAPVLAKK
jgi:hypothetical protein